MGITSVWSLFNSVSIHPLNVNVTEEKRPMIFKCQSSDWLRVVFETVSNSCLYFTSSHMLAMCINKLNE